MMLSKASNIIRYSCSVLQKHTLPQTIWKGYVYDDIDKSKTYRIRAFLNGLFNSNIDEGFYLAHNQFVEAIYKRDFPFISQIASPYLTRKLQLSHPVIQLEQCKYSCQDIIYTDLTAIVGEQNANSTLTKVNMFDLLNLDIYGGQDERIRFENITLDLEMFIVSDKKILTENSQILDDEEESIYHRFKFNTRISQEASSQLDFVKLMLLSNKKKVKYLQKYLLGKQFEWRIKEIDNFIHK